jgi:hypothetical protein
MKQKKVVVTIERPDDHTGQLQHARNLKKALDAGSSGLSTVALGNRITDAQDKQTAVATNAPGSAEERNSSFLRLFMEEDNLRGQMLTLVYNMSGSIDAKIAFVLANGFQIRDMATISKKNFVVVDGPVSGSNLLIAKGTKDKRTFHEWQDSIDGGTTWRYILSTVKASRISEGYTVGQLVKYRHRMIDKNGPREWDYAEIITR